MTPLQRYQSMLTGGTPDHLPRIPILMQFAAEHIGSNYGAFASDHRVLVEANIACAEEFGFEQVSCICYAREAAAFGNEVEFVNDGPPRFRHYVLEDNRDIAQLSAQPPEECPHTRDLIDAVRLYRQRVGDHYSVLGWVEGPAAAAADLRGVSTYLLDMMDEPEWCEELMNRCVAYAIDFARAQIAAGADTIGVGDAIASQVSARLYTKLILPLERKLVDAIHAAGARVRLHICGNITHILPGIATLGVDLIDIDHMVDLATARKILGPRIVLVGGIDPVTAILNADPETIRRSTVAAAQQAHAPYCVAGGCEIPSRTAAANLHALCVPLVQPEPALPR
ncbi:MAG: uroporphyrinogen decarboxylase family protein [Planctomycetota bacterium]